MFSFFLSVAWDDGKIRAFLPESGKPAYVIHDAHSKGVSALAVTSTSSRVISGGGEGQVRVWDMLQERHQTMRAALKEHKGTSYSAQSHTGLYYTVIQVSSHASRSGRDDEEVIHTHALSSV